MTLLNSSQNSTGYIQTGGFFSLHIIPGFLPPKPLADLLTIYSHITIKLRLTVLSPQDPLQRCRPQAAAVDEAADPGGRPRLGEVGSGPTRSTCRCVNRRSGTGMLCVAAAGCRVTFPLWQVWQSRHHLAASAAHPRHTNLLDNRRLVARIPGCASPWMAANTADLKAAGTSGRATPVDTSHRTSAPWIWSSRICRVGLAAASCTSGQDPCAAAIAA